MSLFETCKVRRLYLLTTIDALFLCRCCVPFDFDTRIKTSDLYSDVERHHQGRGDSHTPIWKGRGCSSKIIILKRAPNAPVRRKSQPPPYPGYIGLQRGFLALLAALWVPVRSGSRTSCPEECGALVEICCNPIFRHTWSIKMADTSVHRHL